MIIIHLNINHLKYYLGVILSQFPNQNYLHLIHVLQNINLLSLILDPYQYIKLFINILLYLGNIF